ncbi:monovalent cation/H+ antiporter complex subunit F [Schaalia sp. lx-100]|uniref:monovalent cation/H+ antiporter complex subunit F n=1 Tax=Schaalia sp. lx-100 TaxID=2899081 RepID=UPI001E283CC8|nr:monovalent cation/H+ antiporter complex subunit F [Schaalia sp. lx-100]MCD4557496.1 monovalent cation/H+ antiporter complex subunit F [Schaalia sp. lx-100]
MSGIDVIHTLSLLCVGLAFLLTLTRMKSGPTLLDRIVATDMLTATALAFSAILALSWSRNDISLLLLLLAVTGFISAVIAARFVTREVVGERRILTREEAREQMRQRDEEALADELEEYDDIDDDFEADAEADNEDTMSAGRQDFHAAEREPHV